MKGLLSTLIVLVLASTASAHRLDEYLQATRIDLSLDRVVLEIDLTPGTAVAPRVTALIDADGNGLISDAEAQAYAARVAADVRLEVDGERKALRIRRADIPTVGALEAGLAPVRLELEALNTAAPGRSSLVFRNDHEKALGAYLVNALVPKSPQIAITGQQRDPQQQSVEVTYEVWRPRHGFAQWSWLVIGLVGAVLLGAIRGRRPA